MNKRSRGTFLLPGSRKMQQIFILVTTLTTLTFFLFACQPQERGSVIHANHLQHVLAPSLLTSHSLTTKASLPKNIWQIWLQLDHTYNRYVHDTKLRNTAAWIGMNPEHQYTLVGGRAGQDFVNQYYSDDERLIRTFKGLKNLGIKSDLLRYMILFEKGGVYSDIDTVPLKPVDQWLPARFASSAKLVVGIEFDRLDGVSMPYLHEDIQLCQWTIAAAPRHPVFKDMVDQALNKLHELAIQQKQEIDTIRLTKIDVLNMTGPIAWTDVVFDHMRRQDPKLTRLSDLSALIDPELHGDILVLHIDSFGMGQAHSGSTRGDRIPNNALVKHLFDRGWWAPGWKK